MIRKTKDSKFTELELHQMKIIDDLQEDTKILKSEITELNKDKQDLKRIIEFKEGTINRLQQENQQLENNRDKALKIIDSYELGKYDYSIPAGGIIELREVLKGDSDE